MANIEQKINEIIEKVKRDIERELFSQDKIRQILNGINGELGEIEKIAEEKQKKIIIKKTIDELRNKIYIYLKDLTARYVKVDILVEVRDKLEELRNEIIKLEKPSNSFSRYPKYSYSKSRFIDGFAANGITSTRKADSEEFNSKNSIVTTISAEDSEELVSWRELGQSPKQVDKNIRRLVEGFLQLKISHDELQKNLQVVAKVSNSDDLIKFSESVTRTGVEYARLGGELGGWFPGLKQAGGLIGAYLGAVQGFSVAGMNLYKDTLYVGTDLAKKTGTDLKEYALETQGGLKDVYENTREGAQKVTEKAMDNAKGLIAKGIKTLDIVGTLTEGISEAEIAKAKAASEVEIAKANSQARVEEIDSLKKQLEDLKEEKEKQIKELKEEKEKQIKKLEERIEKKEERIRVLEENIERLQGKVELVQDKLIAKVEETVKSRASLSLPSYNKQ